MTAPLTRLPWLMGLVLLTVSLLGAGTVLQPPAGSATAPGVPAKTQAGPQPSTPAPPPNGLTTHGFVDVEPGLLYLGPLQAGEVVELLVVEGQKVNKGDVLLKVQDEPYLDKVAQAEIGHRIAEAQLAKARQALEQYPSMVEAQKAAVRAAEHQVEVAKSRERRAEQLRNASPPQMNEHDYAAAKHQVESLNAALNAEKAKLKQLELGQPQAQKSEAEAYLAMAKARIDEARRAADRCKLKAPVDGTILRVFVGVGSQLEQGPRIPAVVLCPAGPRIIRVEVDQEFVSRLSLHQSATIHDDANPGPEFWTGKVIRISQAFQPPRRQNPAEGLSPLGVSDARPLEAIVDINDAPHMPRIGQRMRVTFGQPPRTNSVSAIDR